LLNKLTQLACNQFNTKREYIHRHLKHTYISKELYSSINDLTCPLQKGPAPIPMVGIRRADVAAAATGGGTHSRTTEKHPASCKASAVSTTCTEQYLSSNNKIHKTQFKWEAKP
jgi:hypothetical protein